MPDTYYTEEERDRMVADRVKMHGEGLAPVLKKNIETVIATRAAVDNSRTPSEKLVDMVTAFSGSLMFLYGNLAFFGLWIIINLGWTPIHAYDPFPFGLLTTIVSLEAIILSLFVLITQNRMQTHQDRRADLDLQINLLAEHEITRILEIVDKIAQKVGVQPDATPDISELKKETSPEAVLNKIEDEEQKHQG